jgi:hypothetical protein
MFYIVLWSDGVGVFTHISNFWGPLKACQTVGVCPLLKAVTLGKDLIRIIATKFGLILFSGSQEEIQNVKSLQRDAK